MSTLRIATWNINSLRLRMKLLPGLIAALQPDVLCLQETKVDDPQFPHEEAATLGFAHELHWGMKGYNGVAIFSHLPMTRLDAPDWCNKGDCRHLAAGLSNGVTIHNFYVPAGGDVPDRVENPKFGHKLDFITQARDHFAANTPKRAVLVGDLNIAPLEHDVWSHKQLLDVVSHTPVETAGLLDWQAQGWHDAVRQFVPENEKLYSWWSYRNKDWRASNRGRRLDHVWTTPDLTPLSQQILVDARDWEKGSDHVPVCVEVAI